MVVSAAHPIWVGDQVKGAVIVEETTNAVLAERNRAFERLFNIVLAALLVGSLALTLVRVAPVGAHPPPARRGGGGDRRAGPHPRRRSRLRAGDEIGDLSRSFSSVLDAAVAVRELPGEHGEPAVARAAHADRGGALARSTTCALQTLPDDARVYIERAQQGLARLTHILTRMTEATRLEQSLARRRARALRPRRGGCAVASTATALAYPGGAFALELPPAPVLVDGAPDLDRADARQAGRQRGRVPFLASALLIAVGMWIRLTVAESPIFQEALDAKSAAKMPVLDALKTYPKEIALAAGSFVATHATFYIVSVWLISYATTKLGYDRTTILNANAALSLSDIPMILAFGLLSDYIGRRKMFLTGMAVLALFAVPYFMLVSTSQHLAVSARRPHRPGLSQRGVRAAVGLLRRAVLHQNALQRQLTGLPVRRDPRGHGAADLHRARRHDRKRVLGRRVRHRHSHGLVRLLVPDDGDPAHRTAQR